ncbi:phosphate regulon sensor histidine kinase PhoR [Hydrogenophaga sp. OTU3427]|uniref:phosphate regulon sensor histidine kinase PhoR n=1 Tax=Hydrogenophaga sp. OTU3427 TaxID=3043856 RepID=UPI00313E8837
MIRRAFELVALAAAGAAWGVYTASVWATFAGALAGALLWALIDSVRAGLLLRWLSLGEPTTPPRLSSVWGEVGERARKAMHRLTRQAAESETRLQEFLAAIQASPNGVVLLDAAWRIEWCNLTAAGHLGFDAKRDLQQFIKNLVRDPAFATYLSVGDFSGSVDILGRDFSQEAPQRISLQVHPYAEGRKLLLTRDVTAVQLAEAMRRDFVANVSHEIRTPLTVLSGFVETMQHLPLDESDRQRYLGLMAQQAQRMQTLVNDLLTLSRLEGSPVPGIHEHFDSTELLDEVLEEARGLSMAVSDGGHQIEAVVCPALRLSGSRNEWHSALSNLLSNAVRYTPAGGTIRAGWRLLEDGSAEFSVTDTGQGIAAEHLPRLTERFYRVDRSRSRETGGTGLGLAIVKHVVQRHGGQVRVDSKAGKGSTFTLSLPALRVWPLEG